MGEDFAYKLLNLIKNTIDKRLYNHPNFKENFRETVEAFVSYSGGEFPSVDVDSSGLSLSVFVKYRENAFSSGDARDSKGTELATFKVLADNSLLINKNSIYAYNISNVKENYQRFLNDQQIAEKLGNAKTLIITNYEQQRFDCYGIEMTRAKYRDEIPTLEEQNTLDLPRLIFSFKYKPLIQDGGKISYPSISTHDAFLWSAFRTYDNLDLCQVTTFKGKKGTKPEVAVRGINKEFPEMLEVATHQFGKYENGEFIGNPNYEFTRGKTYEEFAKIMALRLPQSLENVNTRIYNPKLYEQLINIAFESVKTYEGKQK